MGIEIERKFLVTSDAFLEASYTSTPLKQGYISRKEEATVRVRIKADRGILTIKGRADEHFGRAEFEYEIPQEDALQLLATMCEGTPIEKTRHLVEHAGHTWEVDVFQGENDGLVVAEIELSTPDERFELPEWVGEDVTDDPRYLNARLIEAPYSKW
ncbi:MAG: CYTH domain-containing protein [Myxococcota bacterium]